MSRFILVAMMVAVTVAGCNRFPDNGLQIVANLPPNDSCVFTADQDIRLLRGGYDISYRNAISGEPSDYIIAPLLVCRGGSCLPDAPRWARESVSRRHQRGPSSQRE